MTGAQSLAGADGRETRAPARYAYYPGCSLHGTSREFDESLRAVATALGVSLTEIPDWSCCGASSGHTTDHMLGVALPARNLAIAEEQGFKVSRTGPNTLLVDSNPSWVGSVSGEYHSVWEDD